MLPSENITYLWNVIENYAKIELIINATVYTDKKTTQVFLSSFFATIWTCSLLEIAVVCKIVFIDFFARNGRTVRKRFNYTTNFHEEQSGPCQTIFMFSNSSFYVGSPPLVLIKHVERDGRAQRGNLSICKMMQKSISPMNVLVACECKKRPHQLLKQFSIIS